jgi:hypothetical protein
MSLHLFFYESSFAVETLEIGLLTGNKVAAEHTNFALGAAFSQYVN